MVAKSFQSMKQITEPYLVSGRMYVKVLNEKTGAERQVRWYTDAEYAKMYPDNAKPAESKIFRTQKEVLGFTNGYITIFKGDTYAGIDWFRASNARYTRWWGWYIISTEEIPDDLPKGIEPIRLPWESVGNDNGKLKLEAEVISAVDALLYDPGTSEFVGAIGERIEVEVTVVKNIELDNDFGHSTMHIFEDACGNQYVWTTSAKNWAEGSVKTIRGTVKDHRTYRNTKQTILNRCAER